MEPQPSKLAEAARAYRAALYGEPIEPDEGGDDEPELWLTLPNGVHVRQTAYDALVGLQHAGHVVTVDEQTGDVGIVPPAAPELAVGVEQAWTCTLAVLRSQGRA